MLLLNYILMVGVSRIRQVVLSIYTLFIIKHFVVFRVQTKQAFRRSQRLIIVNGNYYRKSLLFQSTTDSDI